MILDLNEFLPKNGGEDPALHLLFLEKNRNRIKHNPFVHAKAIIGENSAIFGSFNLTFSGVQNNYELGLFTRDTGKVKLLSRWFTDLWNSSESVNSETLKLIKKLHLQKPRPLLHERIEIPFRGLRPNHKIGIPKIFKDKKKSESWKSVGALSKMLKTANPRMRELLRRYVERLNLTNDDPRVVWTFRNERQLSLTLNYGYVFVLQKYRGGRFKVYFSLPKAFVQANRENFEFRNPWKKKVKGEIKENFWCELNSDDKLVYSPEFFEAWQESSEAYLAYGIQSAYRRHHQDYILDLIRR